MKKLNIKTQHYQQLEKDFGEWLQTLGYSETTVKKLPIYVREFFYYLEQHNKTQIQQATEQDINDFFQQWKKRKNQRTGAGLSSSHINNGILAYNKFIKYLSVTGKHEVTVDLAMEEKKIQPRVVLTKQEIKSLYKTIDTYPEKRKATTPCRLRDRAILALFYGCGLRRNEGANLVLSDVLTEKKMLLVRKGKGSKERYVPVTENNLQDLQSYVTEGRSWFLEDHRQSAWNRRRDIPFEQKKNTDAQAFFVNEKGKRLTSAGIYIRIKYLQKESGINKSIGLHTLRHSIATHLLQSGMNIELISKFLGHSTLESTQIYTHIVNEL